jgi:hypothetical protein
MSFEFHCNTNETARTTAIALNKETTSSASAPEIESKPTQQTSNQQQWMCINTEAPDCITRACRLSGVCSLLLPLPVSVKLRISVRKIDGTSCSHPSPNVRIKLPTMPRQSGSRPQSWAISKHTGEISAPCKHATPASSSTESCKSSNSSSTSAAP